jgi:hypothetical protein
MAGMAPALKTMAAAVARPLLKAPGFTFGAIAAGGRGRLGGWVALPWPATASRGRGAL